MAGRDQIHREQPVRRNPTGTIQRRRRGISSQVVDVLPKSRKEFHTLVKKRKRRRLNKAKRDCRAELFKSLKKKVGAYNDPPKKPTYNRYRQDIKPSTSGILGSIKLIDAAGHVVSENILPFTSYPHTLKTWDQVHPWIQSFDLLDCGFGHPTLRVNRSRYREGGPLHIYRCRIPVSEIQGQGSYQGRDFRPYNGYLAQYDGGFVPGNWSINGYSSEDFMNSGQSGPIGLDFESPASYGAQAYNRYKPKTQAFDAMQFLFDDVKDLPQQLRTTGELMKNSYDTFLKKNMSRSDRLAAGRSLVMPRNVADQFLNYQFGWAPFIGDLIKLGRAYNSFEKRYAQVKRDNGHWIRRGGTVISRESSAVNTINGAGVVYPVLTSDYYSDGSNSATSNLYTLIEKDVWFSGMFKYYIPGYHKDLSDLDNYELITAMMRHYGVGISPSVIWELTPWTWLVDWFSNASDVISNISSVMTDQLVSRYAFVMCHAKHMAINDTTIHLNRGNVKCFWYQEVETKKRTDANPYGFGLTWESLSLRQLGILAALGITRGESRGLTGGPS